jgi:hypothetical protein
MNPAIPPPVLTRTIDAWLVEIPSLYGGCQRYRFAVEAQARRFFALFTDPARRPPGRSR